MAKSKKPKSLAEQFADITDIAPKDFDPEDAGEHSDESGSFGSDIGDENGREHYEAVGKSKLRKPESVSLGPQYFGLRIARDALDKDDDSDDPFSREYSDEDSEEAEAAGGAVRSLGKEDTSEEEATREDFGIGVEPSGEEASDDSGDDEDGTHNEDDFEREGGPGQVDGFDRSELRKLMADDQKTVAATISQAAKSDVEKGEAVKKQRTTFDTLVNNRIKLQKALVSANSLSGTVSSTDEAQDTAFSAAENAAIKLWNNLNCLRTDLLEARTGQKRKHFEITSATPMSDIWKESQAYETEQIPHRNSTLNFWSAKCRATTATLQARGRLTQSSTPQNLSDVLAAQMVDMPRLVARTRIPRSCAPLQAAAAAKNKNKNSSTNGTTNGDDDKSAEDQLPIYDDADFYSTLLQSLISQRSSEMTTTATSFGNLNVNLQPWQAAREAKTKKIVDTRASKGRKLRYTVHEKLQNFMAPEDRGEWDERQADELFATLFGRKIALEEEMEMSDGNEEVVDVDAETAGLRLFAVA